MVGTSGQAYVGVWPEFGVAVGQLARELHGKEAGEHQHRQHDAELARMSPKAAQTVARRNAKRSRATWRNRITAPSFHTAIARAQ
jgi:hypothetical protein